MTTQTANAAPAGNGNGVQDTRAEKSHHGYGSTLGSISTTVLHIMPILATPTAVRDVVSRATKQPGKREQERAARQAEATVRRLGPGSWAVQSASNPEQEHEVHSTPGGLVCTCPAHGLCWHVRRVAGLHAEEQRRQARYDAVWIQEFSAPSLVGPERLAAARLAASYGEDERVWGEEAAL